MAIALLVMNISSAAHADCLESQLCDTLQAEESLDSSDQDGQQNAACDCCTTCGHHHHTHAALSHVKAEHFAATSEAHHGWGGDTYFSQLHYPPSKPPKHSV